MYSQRSFDDFSAERPVLVIGNGVHLAGAEEACRALVEHLRIPVLSSWTAADIVPSDNPFYIGRFGLFGDRAANFTIQNADLILVIGCRLSIPQIGHQAEMFAPQAKIVMVDVDDAELDKPTLRVWKKVREDAASFIRRALDIEPDAPGTHAAWLERCRKWKARYPMSFEPRSGAGVNSFEFIERLSEALDESAVVVTDMGTSFTCTFQAARMKLGQRWITASGHAPMGYGLPGAIGAHYATGKPVVCITGDGGLQVNVQELAQVAGQKLPITVFVMNNGGYLTMKHTQKNHFGRLVGADAASGLHMPSLYPLASAHGLHYARIEGDVSTSDVLGAIALPRPCVVEVMMGTEQPLIPRVQTTRDADGTLRGGLLEDMHPLLPREEFIENMPR